MPGPQVDYFRQTGDEVPRRSAGAGIPSSGGAAKRPVRKVAMVYIYPESGACIVMSGGRAAARANTATTVSVTSPSDSRYPRKSRETKGTHLARGPASHSERTLR